jgi:hypothetical protein
MHPRTEELLRHLDANRAVLRAAVDDVPPSLRETRPAPDVWSVAEVLEHLTRVEEQLTRLLGSKLSEARAAGALGPEADTASVVDPMTHKVVLDRRHRITAGDRVLPHGELDAATALAALESARDRLRELLIAHDGVTIAAVSHPHPVLGPVDAYGWFAFVGSHEARHAAQIREAGATLSEHSV